MTMTARLESLEKKHEQLDEQINDATAAPSADNLQITDMKRKKLQLKDEIEKVKSVAS